MENNSFCYDFFFVRKNNMAMAIVSTPITKAPMAP